MPGVIVMLVEVGRRERWPVLLVAVAHGVHGMHDDVTALHSSPLQHKSFRELPSHNTLTSVTRLGLSITMAYERE